MIAEGKSADDLAKAKADMLAEVFKVSHLKINKTMSSFLAPPPPQCHMSALPRGCRQCITTHLCCLPAYHTSSPRDRYSNTSIGTTASYNCYLGGTDIFVCFYVPHRELCRSGFF